METARENLTGYYLGHPGALAKRLHLHARSISLPHPSGEGQLEVTAPLPPHMAETWAFLDRRIAEVVKVGDRIQVRVLDVDLARRRISLSARAR